ncbi:TonB-dependent receptor plug domain-containing protein [Seonamhaeicola sp. MEBiC1930]|uniref:TonB-dependent receptor plug domain-containing protein n=1 Tax=Seonamhaeicola sp. MEBiC01930 TaxID=2976768 RepID=UPI0032466485
MKKVCIRNISLCLVLVFLINIKLGAQEKVIKGVVTTFEDIHVVKAEVKSLRTKEIVLTDTIGVFKITCLPGDKIRVSAKGFNSESFKVTENTTTAFINLKLKPNLKNRELAVAYGHVQDEKNLNAIASIHTSDKSYSDFYSVYEILNQIPNVRVNGSQIVIRGQSSVNGTGAALIVIDGDIQTFDMLSNLSPQNIKNISVLKGIAASAYGSRGANGVVLVTTKKSYSD